MPHPDACLFLPLPPFSFPFPLFQFLFTLLSKFFSSFAHATCLLSVSRPYLAFRVCYPVVFTLYSQRTRLYLPSRHSILLAFSLQGYHLVSRVFPYLLEAFFQVKGFLLNGLYQRNIGEGFHSISPSLLELVSSSLAVTENITVVFFSSG